jgi:hypothetical protein
MKFEIRITSYNRPVMLRRALRSIRAQTYPDWIATVYDDSTDTAAQEVVARMADPRVIYRRNPRRLGAVKNVDQCMAPNAAHGGAYGCLLEDDKFWLPDYLAAVAARLHERPWNLVQTNQRYADAEGHLRPGDETTRGDWFADGPVTPLALRATLFFMEGVSNSGLVWRLDNKVDLRVGAFVASPGLNEACRSLLVGDPFLFIAGPLGVYTTIERSMTARADDRNRTVARGMQRIRDYLLRTHGRSIVAMARRIAERKGLTVNLAHAAAYSGRPLLALTELGRQLDGAAARSLLKGMAIRLVESDPCAVFFKDARIATVTSGGGGNG